MMHSNANRRDSSSLGLTVGIMCQNNADFLPRLLSQVSPIAEEVLLIDGGSTDETPKIASTFPNVRLISRPFDGNFAKQRNFGIEQLRSEWMLFVDSDELLGPNLITILPDVLASPFHCVRIPRYWLSQEYPPLYVETPKLYPNYQTRLIRNRPEIRFDEERPVHERIRRENRGPRLTLKHSHILHYCFAWKSREDRRKRCEFYASIDRGTDYLNQVYCYEDNQHVVRPCRESWHGESPRVESQHDLLRERLQIWTQRRLISPISRVVTSLRKHRSDSRTATVRRVPPPGPSS
jgi:glycosyltransferase involved in cell wall biosynthesis